ncbi:MAG: hypothetical protein ISR29_03790 [SAR86 cluster bacterium]|uniref:Uncharacterized protein n=1 Tax=SAR86 cluster bacterium TaxID=2030880 RepID=A0A937JFV0_9GAMM|nr:hypothetical protein [SAR86 cluster bacterium]
MYKKILFLLLTFSFLPFSSADSHNDKSVDKDSKVGIFGYWKKEDCKKISEASGRLLYSAGVMLEESRKHREAGHPLKAEQSASAAKYLAEMASHYANNFEAYCKRPA